MSRVGDLFDSRYQDILNSYKKPNGIGLCHVEETIKCPCGVLFVRHSKAAKHCPTCAAKRKAKRAAEANERLKEKRKRLRQEKQGAKDAVA